jgi:DNA-binding transcriptional regulator YiaG
LDKERQHKTLDKVNRWGYTRRIVMEGKQLRAIRERLNLTQVQFAQLVGVTSNTVARWERGEMAIREPTARLIQSINAAHKKRRKGTR